ncbi:MAG: RNA polymerase sigma factor [Pseudomonadales bacterium]
MSQPSAPAPLRDLLNQGYRYALSLCHDSSLADDLLQEGWLALLQAKGPKEKAYLFRAIRSRFLNRIKREQLVVMVPLDVNDIDEMSGQSDEWNTLADLQELEVALQQLRPVERETLFLHAAEGYTAQEIGQHTGQPRGTVLSLIQRARHKLKRWIKQQSEVKHG